MIYEPGSILRHTSYTVSANNRKRHFLCSPSTRDFLEHKIIDFHSFKDVVVVWIVCFRIIALARHVVVLATAWKRSGVSSLYRAWLRLMAGDLGEAPSSDRPYAHPHLICHPNCASAHKCLLPFARRCSVARFATGITPAVYGRAFVDERSLLVVSLTLASIV